MEFDDGGGSAVTLRKRYARSNNRLREALQRLINGAWRHPNAKPCFSIPVNEVEDADCIISDGLAELEDARRVCEIASELLGRDLDATLAELQRAVATYEARWVGAPASASSTSRDVGSPPDA